MDWQTMMQSSTWTCHAHVGGFEKRWLEGQHPGKMAIVQLRARDNNFFFPRTFLLADSCGRCSFLFRGCALNTVHAECQARHLGSSPRMLKTHQASILKILVSVAVPQAIAGTGGWRPTGTANDHPHPSISPAKGVRKPATDCPCTESARAAV